MIRLVAELDARGWRQKDLSEAAGLAKCRVSNLCLGRARPPRYSVELLRCARALGIPVSEAGTLIDPVDDSMGARAS